MKRLLTSAIFGAALTVGASVSAIALPSAGTVSPAAGSIVEMVHGYHRHCASGPRGWVHRHTHDDDRVPCRHHYREGGYYGGGYHHGGYYRDTSPGIVLRFGPGHHGGHHYRHHHHGHR